MTDNAKSPCELAAAIVRPWYLISPTCLTVWDKLRLLLGCKLYIRFDAPNGQCSAACDHSWAVSRAKYAAENLPWRWGNNWHRPNTRTQRPPAEGGSLE